MKNTMITLASIATLAVTANAQTALDFGTLTDTSGNLLGASGASSGSQVFNLDAISGGPQSLTVSWNGDFMDGAAKNLSTAQGEIVSNRISGAGSNKITFSFSASTNISVAGLTNIGQLDLETGSLVADGNWNLASSTVTSLTGVGTNTLSYTASEAPGSQFDAGFTGSIFTYNYSRQPNASHGPQSTDGFIVSVGQVPEPSSTALLGLGGLALILRRKK